MSDNPSEALQAAEVAHMGPADLAEETNEPSDLASGTLESLVLTGNDVNQPDIIVNSMEHPALPHWANLAAMPQDNRLSPGLPPAGATRLMRGTRTSGSSGAGSIAGSRPHSSASSYADSSDAGSVSSCGSRRGGITKGHKRNRGKRLTGAAQQSVIAAMQQVTNAAASDTHTELSFTDASQIRQAVLGVREGQTTDCAVPAVSTSLDPGSADHTMQGIDLQDVLSPAPPNLSVSNTGAGELPNDH